MIKFYSTHCPRCNVLQKKLDNKNIKYEISTDTQEMIQLGLVNAPALLLENGQLLDFKKSIEWVDSRRI